MGRYISRRLALAIPTLIGVTILAFLLTHVVPGDPAETLVGQNATPQQLALARHYLKVDRPLYDQYWAYIRELARGNLGISISGQSVVKEFATRFPATLELTLVALLYAVAIGIPLGRIAGRRSGRFADLGVGMLTLFGLGIPTFVLGLLLQYIFALRLHLLPASGQINLRYSVPTTTHFLVIDTLSHGRWTAFVDSLRHLILPAVTLGSLPLAYIARLTRASIVEQASQDYVRTARGKGLAESDILSRHIMPNAWLPVITIIGLQVGTLLAGAVITETVFAWNGVGSWVVESIQSHDYVVVQSAVLLFALGFLVVNLIVDLLYTVLDPRIRYA